LWEYSCDVNCIEMSKMGNTVFSQRYIQYYIYFIIYLKEFCNFLPVIAIQIWISVSKKILNCFKVHLFFSQPGTPFFIKECQLRLTPIKWHFLKKKLDILSKLYTSKNVTCYALIWVLFVILICFVVFWQLFFRWLLPSRCVPP
jgi:hypothetical protein